jgi:hypothetical protein
MSAYKAAVSGEGDVAFKHAGAHSSASHYVLGSSFGDLKCATTAVTHAEVSDGEGPILTGTKLVLEWGLGHVVDEVVRTGSQRDIVV